MEQINKKDRAIDSLLNQLPKKNNLTPQNKTSNAQAKTTSIQTEVITDSKWEEFSKQTENGSTKKVQNENKKTTRFNLTQSTSLCKKAFNASTKMLTILKTNDPLTTVTSIWKVRNP